MKKIIILLILINFLTSCGGLYFSDEELKKMKQDRIDYQNKVQEWDQDNYNWSKVIGKKIDHVSAPTTDHEIIIYFKDTTRIIISAYKYDMKIID